MRSHCHQGLQPAKLHLHGETKPTSVNVVFAEWINDVANANRHWKAPLVFIKDNPFACKEFVGDEVRN
jgi:hypothetical protein